MSEELMRDRLEHQQAEHEAVRRRRAEKNWSSGLRAPSAKMAQLSR